MKRTFMLIVLLAIMIGFASAQGKETKQITLPIVQTELAQGEGKDKVATLCNICHSVDYITMQPKSSKPQWTSAVAKMRKVFGAPMSDADADVIIKYLSEQYGTGK
jgi:mono/diheme cytochrome c family protein